MKLLFTKYSRDRKDEYKIKTCIYEDDYGKKIVTKEALSESAKNHIKNIYNNYFLLQKFYKNLKVNKPEIRDGMLLLEYEDGNTLSHLLLEAIKNNDKERIYEILDLYKNIIIGFDENNHIDFYYTNEFNKNFGENIRGLEGCKSLKVSNLDLNLDNIIIDKNKIVIVDYEWVCTYPIPIEFILYRNIMVFYNFNHDIINDDIIEIIFNYLSIPTNNKIKNILAMNNKFYDNIQNNNGINESIIKENYARNIIQYEENDEAVLEKIRIQAFVKSEDEGFSEKKSVIHNIKNGRHIYRFEFDKYENINKIRIDPTDSIAKIKIHSIKVYNKLNEEVGYKTINTLSIIYENDELYCIGNDPQIIIEPDNDDADHIEIDFEYIDCKLDDVAIYISQQYINLVNSKKELEINIEKQSNIIGCLSDNIKIINNIVEKLNENISENNKMINQINTKIKEQDKQIENDIILLQEQESEQQKKLNYISEMEKIIEEKERYIAKINNNMAWKVLKRLRIL